MTTLVGWNGSAASRAALDWAIAREYVHDRHVILCRVDEDAGGGVSIDALRHLAASLQGDRAGVRFGAELLHGDAAAQLERRCSDGAVLVIGSGSRDDTSRRFGESLGMVLAARGSVRVVIVPLDASRGAPGVVVGVDGSPASCSALDFAADEASTREEVLTVVHAWGLRPVDEDGACVDSDRISAETLRQRQALEHVLAPVRRRHPDLRIERRYFHGQTVFGLLTVARSSGLLVLGADDPRRSLRESVNRAVVSAMHLAVAIIPSDAALGVPGEARHPEAADGARIPVRP